MAVQLVLATHNAHKVEELRRILGHRLDGIELLAYDGPEPIEDGVSFEANALIKARAAAAHSGLPAIADDSGISVDALGGAPGIHSARYAGTGVDADNTALLLKNLEGVDDRSARFVCAAAFITPDGVEEVVRADWAGSVLLDAVGGGGFGYDPVFKPAGLSVSCAELRPDEKDAISHRSQAFGALLPLVRERLLSH
ncbi:RdgB/HAM1 family non-canonical purine NTP pyrophosphatase [soil metagenome]